jgi:hypothetical protein
MHSLRELQPPSVVNIEDLRRLAKRRLPKVIWDYLEGGAEDEVTLRRNRAAFDRYHLLPRMVTGKGSRDLSITLFGQRLAAPFMIGPTGLNGIYVPDADLSSRARPQRRAWDSRCPPARTTTSRPWRGYQTDPSSSSSIRGVDARSRSGCWRAHARPATAHSWSRSIR